MVGRWTEKWRGSFSALSQSMGEALNDSLYWLLIITHPHMHRPSRHTHAIQTAFWKWMLPFRDASLRDVYWQPFWKDGVRACEEMWYAQIIFHYWKSLCKLIYMFALISSWQQRQRLWVSDNSCRLNVTVFCRSVFMCFYQTSCSIGLPKIEMKNKNGTTQGGLDGVCVCGVCLCACVLGRIAVCGYYDIFSKQNTKSYWCLPQSYPLQLWYYSL